MIDTGAGVIDEDYRGKVHVLLFNLSDQDFQGDSLFPLFPSWLVIDWVFSGGGR